MSFNDMIEECCVMLRRRQIEGSMPCAKRTAELMREIVTKQKHVDAEALIDDVRAVGHKLQSAKPVELSIGNIVRRVLHIIREEAQHEAADEAADASASSVPNQERPQHPQAGPGLLSQVLRSGGVKSAVSLSNLLDGIEDLRELMSAIEDKQQQQQQPDKQERQQQQQQSEKQQQQLQQQQQEAWRDHASEVESTHGAKRKAKGLPQWNRKQNVIDSINELIDELDNIQQSITIQGVEHIHAKEVILTMGMSDTTFHFLKEAHKKRDFQVVVAEGCPRYDGHTMAKKLAEAGVQATLISDSAVFAMMARANKVLVGAHAVLANGGVVGPCGINMVALAARKHSVPFVVLVGLHKLSPLFPHDPDLAYNDFKSPSNVIDFDVLAEAFSHQQPSTSAAHPDTSSGPLVHVPNPTYDYVPPHLISLFVTDMGGYTPSYVYRLLAEFYDRSDYMLSKQLAVGS